jgi:hypothetical protein
LNKNQDKSNPEAYCGEIQKKAESIKRDDKGRQIIAENVPIVFSSSIDVKNE